jgi:hypothetical protein
MRGEVGEYVEAREGRRSGQGATRGMRARMFESKLEWKWAWYNYGSDEQRRRKEKERRQAPDAGRHPVSSGNKIDEQVQGDWYDPAQAHQARSAPVNDPKRCGSNLYVFVDNKRQSTFCFLVL